MKFTFTKIMSVSITLSCLFVHDRPGFSQRRHLIKHGYQCDKRETIKKNKIPSYIYIYIYTCKRESLILSWWTAKCWFGQRKGISKETNCAHDFTFDIDLWSSSTTLKAIDLEFQNDNIALYISMLFTMDQSTDCQL